MAATSTDVAVRSAVEEFLDAINTGDAERLRSCLSSDPGSVHIGTDPEEWWSTDELVKNMAGMGAVGPSPIRAVVDEVTVHDLSDDAAWLVGRGRFVSDGRERPVRLSGVAVREGDRWTFVHSHASIAVPNDQLFG